ncbi:hypothetical protein CWE09_10865 [Aliidiomarina minuta]|uniref:Zinc-finger domain-containing protein n=1 Tax=Aliidiomarina minuta TaxID=880057 RepID=A0A432W4F5_9GAMM|nr:hypothetical protein [Aliidiomarina minuta]RUO24366.1 hypothetical protein CWE09_10865 [Aliidiomarina minuta]
MQISDQILSAFLDNELPASEMEAVRQAMVENPELAERLAELVLVDEQVQAHASQIDKQPVPGRTLELLNASEDTTDSRWWQSARQRFSNGVSEHMAAAASVLILVGGFSGYWLAMPDPEASPWQLVQQQLSTATSGQTVELADGQVFSSQFSFSGATGELCRVYQLGGTQASENIACYQSDSGWQNMLTVYINTTGEGEYSLASGPEILREQVSMLQDGPVYSLEQEREALEALASGDELSGGRLSF